MLLFSKAKKTDLITLVFALRQSHIAELDDLFWEVSDPTSSSYGKYLSINDIAALVKTERRDKEVLIIHVLILQQIFCFCSSNYDNFLFYL